MLSNCTLITTWSWFERFTRRRHADLSFRCLALTWVIWPLEKSKTSSLSSLRMIMLFWQRLSLVRLAPTMSLMNVGQCLGHSCFRIYMSPEKKSSVSPASSHPVSRCSRVKQSNGYLPVQGSCWVLKCRLPLSANEHQNSDISNGQHKVNLQSAKSYNNLTSPPCLQDQRKS